MATAKFDINHPQRHRKHGGIIYSPHTGAITIRVATQPRLPHTPAWYNITSDSIQSLRRWRYLSDAQRTAWAAYAAIVPETLPGGNTRRSSGYTSFAATSARQRHQGQTPDDDPPAADPVVTPGYLFEGIDNALHWFVQILPANASHWQIRLTAGGTPGAPAPFARTRFIATLPYTTEDYQYDTTAYVYWTTYVRAIRQSTGQAGPWMPAVALPHDPGI